MVFFQKSIDENLKASGQNEKTNLFNFPRIPASFESTHKSK